MHLRSSRVSRKAQIREWLTDRVATIRQIACTFIPGSTPETARKKASNYLARLRKRKQIRYRGSVLLNATGRPEHTYGKRCESDQLEHEVWITEAEIQIGVRFHRNVKVGDTVADAYFVKNGNHFWVELDNESMNRKQMMQKWLKYGKLDGFILVICHSKSRLRRLMKTASIVKDYVLFARMKWLCSTIAQPWIDLAGHRANRDFCSGSEK